VASLGIALASLDEFINKSNAELLQMDKAQGILDNADTVRLDEWNDILGMDIEEVPPAKRKLMGIRGVKAHKMALQSDLSYRLNCIEMLLILLFRHFDYYIELGTRVRQHHPSDLLGSTTSSSFLRKSVVAPSVIGGNESATLIREGNKIVMKLLDKLNQVISSLQSTAGIPMVEERRAFLEMTARKLQGTLSEKLDVIS
jgi:nuclear pore complex protein Nup205